MKVKELTVEQLKLLIKESVEEKLQEILGDPDQGLEFNEDIVKRLRNSLSAVKKGDQGKPVEQVTKELGIEW